MQIAAPRAALWRSWRRDKLANAPTGQPSATSLAGVIGHSAAHGNHSSTLDTEAQSGRGADRVVRAWPQDHPAGRHSDDYVVGAVHPAASTGTHQFLGSFPRLARVDRWRLGVVRYRREFTGVVARTRTSGIAIAGL